MQKLKSKGIHAFIDLNSKRDHPKTILDGIKIDRNGTPLCKAGLRMIPIGTDRARKELIWRCPYGKKHVEKCTCCCSPSSIYGHVVKTKTEWDIRLYTEVPRGTETYKKISQLQMDIASLQVIGWRGYIIRDMLALDSRFHRKTRE